MPIQDAVPYIIRVDQRSGALWIETAAADALLRYDPATRQFESYRLPSRGALMRHLAIDPRSGATARHPASRRESLECSCAKTTPDIWRS